MEVRYETVTLYDPLVSAVGARLRLVILDACRNNPLARSMQRMVASRSISGGSFGQLDAGGRRRTEQSSTAFGDLDSAGRVPSGNRSCPLTLVDEVAGVRQT